MRMLCAAAWLALAAPAFAQTSEVPRTIPEMWNAWCARCHGADGTGGPRGGSIVDGSYLGLVSDQGLRTAVLVGRPALGMPDWRSLVPGRPMSAADVADVVAWLAARRPPLPGQPYPTEAPADG